MFGKSTISFTIKVSYLKRPKIGGIYRLSMMINTQPMEKELTGYDFNGDEIKYKLNLGELKPISISLEEIIGYKPKPRKRWDYSIGGFYMIKDTTFNKSYIGKSRDPLGRLKYNIHLANRNSGIFIDRAMFGRLKDFDFSIVMHYSQANITFFNRCLEGLIERSLIQYFNTNNPIGYNYGKL